MYFLKLKNLKDIFVFKFMSNLYLILWAEHHRKIEKINNKVITEENVVNE